MIGINDWSKIQNRYLEYWQMENHDFPLYRVTGVKKIGAGAKEPPVSLETLWMDTEYIIRQARRAMENRIYAGVAYPAIRADLGPDIFGAILGDDIVFARGTSWAKHVHQGKDFSDVHLAFDENNPWWKKIQQMLTDYITDSKGDYLVGLADWHGGMDALVSLWGPEEVALAVYDCPEEVKRLTGELAGIFQTVLTKQHDVVRPYQDGTTHWMGLWHPGLWYNTSCDFNILVSPEMFEEFVAPPLKQDLAFLDASIYHLDGPGAFRHLTRLLEFPDLHGIQLVYGAGAPPAVHWLPELKQIQAAGKGIHLNCMVSELDTLLAELKPEGLYLDIGPDEGFGRPFNQEEVDWIVRKIEQRK